jgi:hypothetical protein
MSAQSRKGFIFNPSIQFGSTGHSEPFLESDYYINGSINLGYMFGNRLGMFSGIGMSNYNLVYDDSYELVTISTDYIQIPIGVRFISSKFNKFGFYTDFSINTAILTSVYLEDKIYNVTSDDPEQFSPILFQFHLNPGIHFGKNKSSFQIGPVLHASATEMFKDATYISGSLVAVGFRISYTLNGFSAK